MARPSSYTEEIADEICERLANGESLISICEDEHMPSRRTVEYWDRANVGGFCAIYAHAREGQADYMDHKILATAENCTPESAISDRVKIDAYKWRAGRLFPKRYAEKALTDPAPASPVTINVALLSADERASLRILAQKALSAPKTIEHER